MSNALDTRNAKQLFNQILRRRARALSFAVAGWDVPNLGVFPNRDGGIVLLVSAAENKNAERQFTRSFCAQYRIERHRDGTASFRGRPFSIEFR